jgi:glycosyltransferase involved in cell wall biosynthesis
MNIGVDAYYLYMEHIDGLGSYLLELLRELSHIDHENKYFLYTPAVTHRAQADSITINPGFHICEIPGVFLTRRRLWLQSPSLKKRILNDRVDLFLAGAEYFPLFLPRSVYIATVIHDVAFKAMPEAISFTNAVFYNFFFPFFLRRSDQFFTVSLHSKMEMVKHLHIEEKKISVIYNGIDLKKFHKAASGNKKPYILFVGTLQPRKNLSNVLRAFSYIADKIDENLVIVGGSGWKNSRLNDEIQSLDRKVKQRIAFKGYVSGEELARLYREARLFALPSLHEGFCLPILEAMASGTAVLTARRTAIPEIFGDAVQYADPYSPDDISMKIYELVTDRKKRVALEKKGLARSKKYDVKVQAGMYLDSFKKIAATLGKGQ